MILQNKKLGFLGNVILLVSFCMPLVSGAVSTSTEMTSSDILKQLEDTFSKDSVMIDVARCESGLRQFVGTGEVLRGGLGKKMIGIFQLYEDYHVGDAKARGFDIYSLDGNIKYAKSLYDVQGLQPWSSSSLCWGDKKSTSTSTQTTAGTIASENAGLLPAHLSSAMPIRKFAYCKKFSILTDTYSPKTVRVRRVRKRHFSAHLQKRQYGTFSARMLFSVQGQNIPMDMEW